MPEQFTTQSLKAYLAENHPQFELTRRKSFLISHKVQRVVVLEYRGFSEITKNELDKVLSQYAMPQSELITQAQDLDVEIEAIKKLIAEKAQQIANNPELVLDSEFYDSRTNLDWDRQPDWSFTELESQYKILNEQRTKLNACIQMPS